MLNNTLYESFSKRVASTLCKLQVSLDDLKSMSLEEIKALKGIGPVACKEITTLLNNIKGENEMTKLNNQEVRSMVYNNGLNPVVNVEEELSNVVVNPVVPVDLTIEAEKVLLKSLNKKNSKGMKKWYKEYGMNLCNEEMTWKHLENWFTRNITVKTVIHDIPLTCRGDENIRAILERKIQEDLAKKDNKKNAYSNDRLEELVREEMTKLDEEVSKMHVLSMNNKHVKMYRRGQVQCFDMLKLNCINFEARENDTEIYVDINTAMKITGTESNITFKFSDGNMLTDLMIVKLKYGEDDEASSEMVEAFIRRGIIVYDPMTGYERRFRCFLITPSQSRSSNIWICPEERLVDYRKALCNGVEFEGNMIDVHKLETRMALGASNGYILGQRDCCGNVTSYYEYKFSVVEDNTQLITKDLIQNDDEYNKDSKQWIMNGIKELLHSEAKELYEQYLKGELKASDKLFKEKVKPFLKETTDGFGLVDVRLCAHWAYELGLINRIEMNYFIEHFNGFNKKEMEKDSSLMLIYNKIPTAYQIRYQFYKGILVVADLQGKGIDTPILFTKGMEKREEAPVSSGAWRICGYNKKKSQYSTLTSQSVEALGLSFEMQKKMAKASISFLTEAVKTVEGVFEMCAIKEDEEDSNDSMESTLMAILKANPKAFISEYVQKLIMKLVEKRLFGLCRGKFIIHGAYYYMINDPRQILGEETLREGEFYLNNMTQETTLVRYPCVNRLEPQRVTLTACDDLWYLKDLMIFNPYDGTWCAMGGADFDGDICLAIFDEYLVKASKSYPFITDIVTHKVGDEEEDSNKKDDGKKLNNYEARAEVYSRLHKGSLVGLYSKMHSRSISRIYHNCNYSNVKAFSKMEHLERSVMWTFVIGKEIDKAKTYENFVIPQEMEEFADFFPVHLKADTFVRDGAYDENLYADPTKTPFHTNCPRGMFFKWMQKEYGFFTGSRKIVLNNILGTEGKADEKQFLNMISAHVSLYKIEKISKDMRLIYDNYTTFNQNMNEKYKGIDMSEDDDMKKAKAEEYKAKYDYFREQFEVVCEANGYDKRTAAYSLAKIPYEIDQVNVGTTFTDELTGETIVRNNKRSKSCAFVLAEKYMLRLIRASKDNSAIVEIPDALDGAKVVVNNGVVIINGIGYLFDKLVDGTYIAKTSRRCSYIVATREQLKLREVNAIEEQSSSIMTMAQYKDEAMKIRAKHQFPFTICKSEYYGYTAQEVFIMLAGREFGVGAIEDGNGGVQAVIATKDDNGDYGILCGLQRCSRALIGRTFYVQEDILDMVKLMTKGGKVAKSVLFNATEVGFDSTLAIDESLVLNEDFEIKEAHSVENNTETMYEDNDCEDILSEDIVEEASEVETVEDSNEESLYDNDDYDCDCEELF